MPDIQQVQNWYHSADPVHDFQHVLRVYNMAERIAQKEGADLDVVRAAALLHDIPDNNTGQSVRSEHHLQAAGTAGVILKEEGWPDEKIRAVQHCIRAHRYRSGGETPQTLEAKIVYDADKLDVLGAIGVARAVAYAVLHNQPIYASPSQKFLKHGEKEEGEPHTAYHEYLYKLRKIKELLFTTHARQIAQQRDRYIQEYFDRLIKESEGIL
jgi:uncharacterized protein